ncbi:MAG: hypothetical protein M1837_007347 [Sclerophora amabilis]|nr:MAG: hypothetical protein M1837_007347 [Sclerophora amabilis]
MSDIARVQEEKEKAVSSKYYQDGRPEETSATGSNEAVAAGKKVEEGNPASTNKEHQAQAAGTIQVGPGCVPDPRSPFSSSRSLGPEGSESPDEEAFGFLFHCARSGLLGVHQFADEE